MWCGVHGNRVGSGDEAPRLGMFLVHIVMFVDFPGMAGAIRTLRSLYKQLPILSFIFGKPEKKLLTMMTFAGIMQIKTLL